MHLLPTVRSWARRLVAGAVLLAAFYLLAANLFLLPSVGPSLISRRPERFRLGWQSAWSLWPGEVHFRGLEIRGNQPRVRWWITARQGTARIDLAALLRREVRIEDLRAAGVRSRTDRIPAPAGPPPAAGPTMGPAPRRAPWTVRLERVALSRVQEIGYGPLLLQGDGRIDGSFRIVLRREVEVGDTRLVMPAGRLLVRGGEVAREVGVRAELRLGPYSPRRHRGIAGFDFLSGHLSANGKVAELSILDRVGPEGAAPVGPGTLATELRVEKGRLVSGSRLRFAVPEKKRAGARLRISGEVVADRLVLGAEAAGLTLRRRDGTPFLAADRARLTASTPELRLSLLAADVRRIRTGDLSRSRPLQGDVEASGLRLQAAGRSLTAGITAEQGRGQIDLLALLSRRVALDGLEAEGVAVEIDRNPRPLAPADGARQPWTLEIERARIDRLREVRSGPFRVAGAGRLTGSLSWDGDVLEVREGVLDLRKGRIWRGRETLARDLDARLTGGLAPCVLQRPSAPLSRSAGEGPGVGVLDCVTLALRAKAGIHRLRALPAIGRSGPLRVDLRIERGSLRPGSFLELGSRTGGSSVIATVEGGGEPRLAAEVRDLALGGGLLGPPLLRVAAARASVPVADLRLGSLLASVQGGDLPPVADLEATGLRMGAPGERVTWSLAIERASGRIDLQALARREAVLSALRGAEARLAIRKSTPGERPAAPEAPPWSVRITDVRITGVREAAFGANRLVGNGQIEGSLATSMEGGEQSFRLDRLALSFDSARIESERKTVARGVSVLTDLRIAPFTPGELRGARLFRLISGTAAVDGDISSLGFLRSYFRKAPWLILDARGHLSADVRLAAGRLLPGTRLTVDPAEAEAEFLLSRATGTATVQGLVLAGRGEPYLDLAVDFGRFGIAARDDLRGDGAPPHMIGQGLQLSVTSSDLDLAAPGKNVLARIVLPQEAEVRDLAFYNGYLPEGSGVSILGGTGWLGFDLSMETASQTAHGELTLRSDAVRVRVEDLELAGALSLRSRLTSPDLRTRRFSLAGTSLSLKEVELRHVGPDAGPPRKRSESSWWAQVDLESGSMEWTRPLRLTSTVRLKVKDAGFLLSLLSSQRPYLTWFGNRLRRTPLEARGELRLVQGAIEVDPLEVRGGHFDIRSRLRLSRERRHGHLFVRWRRLALGVDLEGRERRYRFVRPLEWFNGQRLEGPGKP